MLHSQRTTPRVRGLSDAVACMTRAIVAGFDDRAYDLVPPSGGVRDPLTDSNPLRIYHHREAPGCYMLVLNGGRMEADGYDLVSLHNALAEAEAAFDSAAAGAELARLRIGGEAVSLYLLERRERRAVVLIWQAMQQTVCRFSASGLTKASKLLDAALDV